MSFQVYETTDELVVERTDIYGKLDAVKEPTLKHPEITVDTIIVNGKVMPKRIHYPKPRYTKDYIMTNQNQIMTHFQDCALCARRQQQLAGEIQRRVAAARQAPPSQPRQTQPLLRQPPPKREPYKAAALWEPPQSRLDNILITGRDGRLHQFLTGEGKGLLGRRHRRQTGGSE